MSATPQQSLSRAHSQARAWARWALPGLLALMLSACVSRPAPIDLTAYESGEAARPALERLLPPGAPYEQVQAVMGLIEARLQDEAGPVQVFRLERSLGWMRSEVWSFEVRFTPEGQLAQFRVGKGVLGINAD